MIGPFVIALAAGAASALMFASIISGALISLVLFYLAPLPLMVAAIAWGPLCAAIGGIAAAISLGALVSFPYCIAFAIAVALPAWWLGHLTLLGRPAADHASNSALSPEDPAGALEWYPIGRILLWIAAVATLTTFAALLTLGTDAATITSTLHRALSRILSASDSPVSADTEQWIDTLINVAPAAAALFATATLTLNLWLAAKIAATSGLLRRPWPDLRTVALPPLTVAALFAAIGLSFAGGLVAILAVITASTLLMAYALTGLAVLHTLSLRWSSRPLWLGLSYALILTPVWPMLFCAMVMLGLADLVFGLRQRFWRRPPPLPVP
ncbi:DUF2232 domain-containing protein [Bradyrhizobium sp. HKCCYLS1011]|uniref:DUF2232 domain-containing protein n=1 Tax=Bradyrhizobium sp. HKCCYLS1011 TaxID=3420733 RepID=UPI003EB96DAF